MKNFYLLIVILSMSLSMILAAPQHQSVDPAYLRQYYQQLQHQPHQHQQNAPDATPIFEQNSEQPQQFAAPGQQLRVKDNVQDQIRAQQQQLQQQQQYVAPAVREYLQHQTQAQQVQYQQPQQVAYRQAQPQAAAIPRRGSNVPQYQAQAPKSKAQLQREEEEYDDQNSSYQFGFDVKDDEFTNYQNRKEVRDGSVIRGSYSVVDSDGFIRTVKYTADPKEGFKAEVIREPTDIVVKVPTPAPQQLLRATPHKSHDYPSKQQYQPQQYHQYQQ